MMGAKGKNFSEDEDVQLCSSYIAVGKDARTKPNQSSNTFWERITMHYQSTRPTDATPRPYRSLESKWHEISLDVSKFCGALANAQALPLSGASSYDEIDCASELFNKLSKNAKSFNAFFAQSRSGRRSGRKRLGVCCNSTARMKTQRGVSAVRPQGVKAANASAHTEAEDICARKRLATATSMLARASMKRVRALEDANHIALFATRLDTLDEDARAFFHAKRGVILEDMMSETPYESDGKRDEATIVDGVGSNPRAQSVEIADTVIM
ncbi:hypothetical protein PybrP1_012938 [[Pythium] brassicae (nom. inval.)]|nr:hypothetical protein PybrP1_012938 [[Pythium] brassicae (nom. inval.)]